MAENVRCEVCGTTEKVQPRPKGSGGPLCNRCNLGIGHFKNDAALLLAGAEYLEATAR